jgi:hypothetical protein
VTDDSERRIRRARYHAHRQGYRLQVRGDLIDIVDPWTTTIAAEGIDLNAVEAWLADTPTEATSAVSTGGR